MHDPQTVAHEIKYPWYKHVPWAKKFRQMPNRKEAWESMVKDDTANPKIVRRLFCGKATEDRLWPEGYRESFITIWHVDPETDHSDDSCGWFMRARHGDKACLQRIVKRFAMDWDNEFTSDGTGKTYFTGLFYPENKGAGMPNLTVNSIAINLFFLAAIEHFNDNPGDWKRAAIFCQKNLFEILLFAENPTDSLRDAITRKWGIDTKRDDRIREMASCVYGWILRKDRPWYKHPRWHVHHWKLQIHPLQAFKRWAFSRCSKCGLGFKWGQSCVSNNWNSKGPSWFGEKDVMHDDCSNCHVSQEAKQSETISSKA